MKTLEIIRQRIHVHHYGQWKLAGKGLLGVFAGELDTKSIQYRECMDDTCTFKQAKVILQDVCIDVKVGETSIASVAPKVDPSLHSTSD